ncbi:hypothetical protein ASPSYDRAFT_466889 [Aspergillus sydowii CBS 593.65]|uniref:Uncharacterized protein n=1 Tax=Aspergillus sydowii CBS 593.65 TaxID=1036612 RepID=A0A1L9T5D9_9EURO|nr:uncharacterized protein ASPSYDRAFT_466889 [Aspergillus sydowii CBS 593.65]OJJ54503.1 hypothetical protein ASPSYDRAFT_466889 [Aspergillus sydowii CBS 593.65]
MGRWSICDSLHQRLLQGPLRDPLQTLFARQGRRICFEMPSRAVPNHTKTNNNNPSGVAGGKRRQSLLKQRNSPAGHYHALKQQWISNWVCQTTNGRTFDFAISYSVQRWFSLNGFVAWSRQFLQPSWGNINAEPCPILLGPNHSTPPCRCLCSRILEELLPLTP